MKIQFAEDGSGEFVGLYIDGVLKKSWAFDYIHHTEMLQILGIEFEGVEVDDDWFYARKTGFPKKFADLKIASDS